ncbi:MAG: hypothetical protein A2539_07765 [Elusimicrobia bacterium RIFOXYD2_FULL_34_15]|nr:MAG: hypothetical protein A2539_07765 [Elusimicrobia bacterium RIFOXYD2_FULL_34_15]
MSKKKIMIVDDDQEFLDEIKEVLTSSGYEVVTINDSSSTFEMVTKVKPDVILLDLNMPTKSGFEVASELKYSLLTKHIPIIAISGYLKDEHYISLMEICGIKKRIEKPINPLDIIAKIEGY